MFFRPGCCKQSHPKNQTVRPYLGICVKCISQGHNGNHLDRRTLNSCPSASKPGNYSLSYPADVTD